MQKCCHFPWGKCGLKSGSICVTSIWGWSLPVREVWIEIGRIRLFKPSGRASLPVREVWIEISGRRIKNVWLKSLPVREVWIEMHIPPVQEAKISSLPVREVWIEIKYEHPENHPATVTSREGSVDWNLFLPVSPIGQQLSLPVREVWIEIILPSLLLPHYQSLPVREVWIEIVSGVCFVSGFPVTSREGSVDWNRKLKWV